MRSFPSHPCGLGMGHCKALHATRHIRQGGEEGDLPDTFKPNLAIA